MGLWGTLAKIGGVVAAPFTGGLSLIPTAISAGADITGAIIGSKAASKAAEQQQQAAQRAMELQQPLFQQAAGLYAPYAQQGSQGLSALTSLLGVGGGGVGTAIGSAPNAQGLSNLAMGAGQAGLGMARTMGVPMDKSAAMGGGGPSMLGGGGGGGQTVMLRAPGPNGQTQAVPAHLAQFYMARGATRV